MRRLRFVAFALLPLLSGCATGPSTLPETSVWFPTAEWTPMAGTLLESTETEWGSIASARVKRPLAADATPFQTPTPSQSTAASPPPPTAKTDTSSAPPEPSPASSSPNAEPAIEYAKPGESVKLAASADGTPPFTYQWRKDGQPLPNGTSEVLTIVKATPEHAGFYDCIVSNSAGTKTSPPVKLVIRP